MYCIPYTQRQMAFSETQFPRQRITILKEEHRMIDFKADPRFQGIKPFETKVWNGVYYWGNQEEKP